MELQYDKAGEASADGLVVLPDDALAGIPEYLMRNFGPSFQTEQAMEEIESAVCTGIHEERKLLFTDGLSADAYEGSEPRAQSLRASRDGNLKMLQEHEDAARQGIRSIEPGLSQCAEPAQRAGRLPRRPRRAAKRSALEGQPLRKSAAF